MKKEEKQLINSLATHSSITVGKILKYNRKANTVDVNFWNPKTGGLEKREGVPMIIVFRGAQGGLPQKNDRTTIFSLDENFLQIIAMGIIDDSFENQIGKTLRKTDSLPRILGKSKFKLF